MEVLNLICLAAQCDTLQSTLFSLRPGLSGLVFVWTHVVPPPSFPTIVFDMLLLLAPASSESIIARSLLSRMSQVVLVLGRSLIDLLGEAQRALL